MKTISKLFAITGLSLLVSGLAQADDVTPDEVLRLREAGSIVNLEQLNKAALALHTGAIIEDSELELEHGRYLYQLELRDNAGVEWDLDFDAATGELLSNQRDH